MDVKIDGQKIKNLRVEKSWSQEQLAQEADVSLRTIQRMELDGSASLKSRLAVAKALNVEPTDLDYNEAATSSIPSSPASDIRGDDLSFNIKNAFSYPGPVGISEKIRKMLLVTLWSVTVITGTIMVAATLILGIYFLINPSEEFYKVIVAQLPVFVIFCACSVLLIVFRRDRSTFL